MANFTCAASWGVARSYRSPFDLRQTRVDFDLLQAIPTAMSLAELKEELDRLPLAEKSFLAAYLKHSARRQEPGYVQSLEDVWQRMEAGEKVPMARALELSQDLRKTGA